MNTMSLIRFNIHKNYILEAGHVGVVVKFSDLHFGGPGSWVWIPGRDLHHSSAMLWWQPTKKCRKIGNRCWLRVNLPQQNKRQNIFVYLSLGGIGKRCGGHGSPGDGTKKY